MEVHTTDDYYTSRTATLLREFDKAVNSVKGVFVSRYGESLTETRRTMGRRVAPRLSAAKAKADTNRHPASLLSQRKRGSAITE